MTIAQIVYDNELSFDQTEEEIHAKVWDIPFFWSPSNLSCRSCVSGRSWTTASAPESRQPNQLSLADSVFEDALPLYTDASCAGSILGFRYRSLRDRRLADRGWRAVPCQDRMVQVVR